MSFTIHAKEKTKKQDENINANKQGGQGSQEDDEITQLLSLWTSQELDAETPGDLSLKSLSVLAQDPAVAVSSSKSKFYQTYLKCQQLFFFSTNQGYNDNHQDELFGNDHEDDNDDNDDDDDDDDDERNSTTLKREEHIERNQELLATILHQSSVPILKSKYSKQRMIFLLVQVLVSRCCCSSRRNNIASTTSSSGGIVDGTTKQRVAKLLMNSLCDILSKAKVPLLDKTIQWFHQAQEQLLLQQQQQQQQQQLQESQVQLLPWRLWTQEMMQALDAQLTWNTVQNKANSTNSSLLWPVALSLMVSIVPKNVDKDVAVAQDAKYLTFFLQHAIQQSLASASTLSLAQYYIASMDSTHVAEKVIPALALKLKANPETSMETVHEIVSYMDPSKVRTLTNQDQNQTLVVEQSMLPTIMKQLIHSKESMRHLAGSLLGLLGRFDDTCRIVLQALVGVLLGGGMVKLITAEHRLGVYRALEMIASDIMSKDRGAKKGDCLLLLLLSCVEMNEICNAIVTPMAKETGKAKQVGMVALLKWMSCYQEMTNCLSVDNEEHGGYWLAIDFLSKAILDIKQNVGTTMAGMASEFRFRFEHLFTVCEYHLADIMVGNLWEYAKRHGTEGKLCAGLTYVVDACSKKHGNSNIVAQVDGLIATHILLIFSNMELNAGKRLNTLIATLPPSVLKVLQSGGELMVDNKMTLQSKESSLSFLYSRAMLDAYAADPVVRQLLWRCIELFTKIVYSNAEDEENKIKLGQKGIVRMDDDRWSGAAYTIACCVTQESEEQGKSDSVGEHVVASIESITAHTLSTDRASDAIVAAIFSRVNEISNGKTEEELFDGINSAAIRGSMHHLAKAVKNIKQFAQVMILSHCGLNLEMAKDFEGSFDDYEDILNSIIDGGIAAGHTEAEVADCLVQLISGTKDDEGAPFVLSKALHSSTMSMIITLGKIGATYDEELAEPDTVDSTPCSFAWKLCVKELAGRLADLFNIAVSKSEGLNEIDIALYNSPDGEIFTFSNESEDHSKSKMAKSRMTEEEEWERQVKLELAEKRKKTNGVPNLSKEDKSKIEEQTAERNRIRYILDWAMSGTLSFIRALCHSDIEIGNSILPLVSTAVTSAAVSTSVALNLGDKKKKIFSTLCALAECVFEIDEQYAEALASCLVTCQKRVGESSTEMKVVEFPPNFEYAEIAISAMDDYGDMMSGNSFVFLFPIIRAALTGPRTTQGCESALKILKWHASLIGKDTSITAIRKDMAASVLELLSHDRSKSFKDPTPTETLFSVYSCDKKPSAAELAPLLNESGALGNKNCRLASMTVFIGILKAYPSLIKTNPVVENRVLVNCFAADESIKSEAIRAWKIAQAVTGDDPALSSPSKIFAIAMLPLLSHEDDDISNAAATAFAFGLEKHPDSADKNLNRLFNAYIESYPTVSDQHDSCTTPLTQVPAVETRLLETKTKKAPKLDIGTVKKKPAIKKTAGSAMAALTKTAATKKKSKPTSAMASFAPKKERVIDQESLMSQFVATVPESQRKEEKDCSEKIAIRSGVLRVISALTGTSSKIELDPKLLEILVCFLITFGLADINEKVRCAASIALRDTVASDSFKSTIDCILPLLENALQDGKSTKSCLRDLPVDKVLDDIVATDHRKEGVVIALGSAAIHLRDVEDAGKISSTFNMLINALSTPSESVQASVAICLSKLMKKGDMKSKTEELLESQLQECLHGKTLAARRGAAYGISAIVKGSGIATLKKFSVVKQLEEACTTGSASTKEGALFAIELLSDRLSLLFEPYVIVLLPALLKSFSDTSDHVRSAARNSVGLIMSKLSGHGVKLLVPAVLSGLEQEDWRTKQASIHMLGAMSQCAPKQLASCLPNIVPKVTEAFTDTHPKVKASAANSLEEISKVIRNPEISEISSILLKALTDPSNGTVGALESLIETEFLHAIDAASLSLIVPVIHRGLRDRAATTKRYGALIAGNIVTMIDDPKDFVPYLPILLPDLKSVLLDPIPDCRSISAKALGSLTRSLGEATFPDLRTWLIEVLRDEHGTSVERSGAAQGLTELLCAGGAGLVNEVMKDEILPLIDHPKASTREGVLWVLTFLPASLGQGFAPLIDASFPALISGLSDESESVRDVAMRAGRVTIRSHGKAHVEKILPSLEDGLTDEDHRIRSASLTLLGDLLSVLSGTRISKGDVDTQDDVRQAERAQAQIALILGPDTRKRVLSGLYLRRSDTAAVVRQAAVQVWKSVVSVTPRTLREILDTLVEQIVNALASGHPDHTQVAGRCLGDIVRKLGDAVLPEIMPILKDALYRGDTHTKLGACVGLTEVIACSSKEQILKHLDILVRVVDEALCDNEDEVRKMAASCFQSLYSVVGNKVFDEIVPQLLAAMEGGVDAERARAINGITGILSIRSKELLPYLISRLVKTRPISRNQASALGSIFTVTGGSIHSFFGTIIPTLLSELSEIHGLELDDENKIREIELRNCVRSLCGFVEATGVNALIGEIATKCSNDKESMRAEAIWMMQTVIEERKEKGDFYDQIPIMIREFIHRLNDDSKQVLVAANSGLAALSIHVSTEELVNHIEFIRNLIASMVSDARRRKGGVGDGEFLLPGFNMPKGLEPLLPIYQRGILYGDATIREASAAGLGELMTITSAKFLAGPFIIKVTGPLLRIVGDRNPSAVKIAIIKTLGLILMKGGPALRAFVPQFQTTFLKALSDPSRQVRVEAIKALALLMPLSTRLDPLIKELVSTSLGNGAASSVDSAAGLVAIQTASLEALSIVVKHGGKQAKLPESIPSCLDVGKEMLYHEDEGIRAAAAKVIGAACEHLGEDSINTVAKDLMVTVDSSPNHKHGNACLCHYLLASSSAKMLRNDIFDDMVHMIKKYMVDDENLVREAACVAAGAVLGAAGDNTVEKYISILQPSILKCMDPKDTIEQLKSMARGLSIGAQLNPALFERKSTLPIIDAGLKCAMTAQQRVQFAFNDFLWLALNVKDGEDGLNRYCDEAMFDNSKKMKSLYAKVLIRIKSVNTDELA